MEGSTSDCEPLPKRQASQHLYRLQASKGKWTQQLERLRSTDTPKATVRAVYIKHHQNGTAGFLQ